MKKTFGFLVVLLILAVSFVQAQTVLTEPTLNSPYLKYTLNAQSRIAGTASFTTTDLRDTVSIIGAASTDFYIISVKNDTTSPFISWIAATDKLIVLRKSAGTSGLTYSWLRIRTK
jgi:hypothetical protein